MLLDRAKQIRDNVPLGLSWTCDPARHSKKRRVGKLNSSLSHPLTLFI